MRQRLPIVLSATALIVALLGSTGVAQSTIDRLITSRDIKNNSIRSVDIRNGTVTGRDVKNRSLTGADVKDGTLRAKDFRPGELVEGAPGPQGPPGPEGPAGVQGPPGLGEVEVVNVNSAFNSANSKSVQAPCPAGKRLVGGGAWIVGAANLTALYRSAPLAPFDVWLAEAHEVASTGLTWRVNAYAICARVGG